MGKIARARLILRTLQDKKQDKKIRQLELKTNKALRKAKQNERLAIAREKVAKAQAKAAASERRANTEKRKKNEKRIADLKKFGKRLWKDIRK